MQSSTQASGKIDFILVLFFIFATEYMLLFHNDCMGKENRKLTLSTKWIKINNNKLVMHIRIIVCKLQNLCSFTRSLRLMNEWNFAAIFRNTPTPHTINNSRQPCIQCMQLACDTHLSTSFNANWPQVKINQIFHQSVTNFKIAFNYFAIHNPVRDSITSHRAILLSFSALCFENIAYWCG